MKARKLFRASLRALILLAFGILMTGANAFAFSVTHEFPLPGGGKMTVTSTGKGGVTDHLTWTTTDANGKKTAEGKAKNDGKGGVKSEWTQYDGMGTKTATCSGTSSPSGSKSVTKDLLTGTKTTQWTKLDNNGQKTESGTTVEPVNAGATNSVTTYQNGKPSVTTTTNSNPYSKEEQHWDENGKQVGGSLEDTKGKYDYDPKSGTYGDPGKTKPGNPSPPSYSRLVKTESAGEGLVPPASDNFSSSGLAVALKYINSNLAGGTTVSPRPRELTASNFFNTGSLSHELKFGAGYKASHGDKFLLPASCGEDGNRLVTEHYLAYYVDGQHFDVRVHEGVPYRDTPDGSWSPISEGDPNLYYEHEQGGWSQVYPRNRDAFTFSGFPGDENLLTQLFPTGFDFGASVDFIFGADPNFLVETHHHIVHGHTWKTEKVLVGEETVDADGVPGGPDILVPVFKDEHVRVDTTKKVTTHTKKDISVVEDGDVGGNLNVHYWCTRYVGIEAFNTILSGPGGTVDILGARAEARLPMICGGERHPVGFAPFVYAGCSGTMGGYDDLFGLDIGGGVQVRTRCGFNFSLEAGANLNGTQNYGNGSVNFLWHKPLE
jgi:hypothetical protein